MRIKHGDPANIILNLQWGFDTTLPNEFVFRVVDNETEEVRDLVLLGSDDLSANKARYNKFLVDFNLRVGSYDFFVFQKLTASDNWILALGYWNDDGEWIDSAVWIDTVTSDVVEANCLQKGLLEVYRDKSTTPGSSQNYSYSPIGVVEGVDDLDEYESDSGFEII